MTHGKLQKVLSVLRSLSSQQHSQWGSGSLISRESQFCRWAHEARPLSVTSSRENTWEGLETSQGYHPPTGKTATPGCVYTGMTGYSTQRGWGLLHPGDQYCYPLSVLGRLHGLIWGLWLSGFPERLG